MMSWGISWVNAKVLSSYITASDLIFYRYFITVLTLVPVIIFLKKSFEIPLKTLGLALLAAIFLSIYSIFYFDGTKYGTSGLGGAFVTTFTPILTFVLLVGFFDKKLEKNDIIALVLGAIGTITILNIWSFKYDEIFVVANLYFIYASISWSFLTITNSKNKTTDALVFVFYLYFFTTIIGYFSGTFQTGNIFDFDTIFWLNLIFVSIVSTTFATSVYLVAIAKLGANEASSFILLVPFSAIVASWIFLDEPIYLTTIIGTALTIKAVLMINNKKEKNNKINFFILFR